MAFWLMANFFLTLIAIAFVVLVAAALVFAAFHL
jgi:hypothetical protein